MLSEATSQPISLTAKPNILDGTTQPQDWGYGVSLSALGLTPSSPAAAIVYQSKGFAVAGGRYDSQLEFDAATNRSEQFILDFDTTITEATIKLGQMSAKEWQGLAETGKWSAHDEFGNVVASDILDPTDNGKASGRNQYTFDIGTSDETEFSRIVIEATAYGNGVGKRTNNNSDFNLLGVDFVPSSDYGDKEPPTQTVEDPSPTNDTPSIVKPQPISQETPVVVSKPLPANPTPTVSEPDDKDVPTVSQPASKPNLPQGTQLWSQLNPPANGRVFVAQGETLILDTDTANLGGVIVEGDLIFSETFKDTNKNGSLDFTADWLLVRKGGNLEIGTEDNPYEADTTITLDGADEDVMGMGMGGRFIIAAGTAADGTESRISMHGIDGEKVSWTKLSTSVQKGSKVITLSERVDWEIGDEIIIAASGFDTNEAEKRTVVAVSGNKVTLDKALNYEHFGKQETIGGKTFDMRAEVGLLSRNIDIQGAEDSLKSEFGAHMMFMNGSAVQLSGIEVRRGGQIGKAARYPIHWHLGKDHAGDYLKNSAIYDSFHRGVVLHGVDNVEVESNVVYNVFSHAYVFSEDGNEWNNSLTNNLGLGVKRREDKDFAFPGARRSTQAEHRPSVFWGRNYYNPMVGNHAAGTVDGNGFHFDLRKSGYKNKQAIVNSSAPITFKGNVAHSNGTSKLGLAGYAPITRGHGLMMEVFGGKKSDSKIVFEDFTAYKNEVAGAWMEGKRQVLKNAKLADNSTGVITRRSTLEDSVITHTSSNKVGGVLGVDREFADATDLGGGVHVLLGRGGPTVRNTLFTDLKMPAFTIHRTANLGTEANVSGIKLQNAEPLYWYDYRRVPTTEAGVINDLDGSLSGTGVPSIIAGPSTNNNKKFFDESLNAFVIPKMPL